MNKKTSWPALFRREFPFFLSLPALLWQCIFFYIPLIFLFYISIINTQHLSKLLDLSYLIIISRSLIMALTTATLSMICAYPIAYFLALRAQKMKNTLLFFLLLPFWSSLLILVYAWFFMLEKYGLINTILMKLHIISEPLMLLNRPAAIYLVMLYCYLPFMIMPIYAILEKLDRRLLEASADLGANSLQTALRVTLPLSFSGMRTGFFLVFVPSFGEFVIPQLVGGGKQFFVGSVISHFFLTTHNQELGALFTCISAAVLVSSTLIVYWASRKVIR